VILLITIWNVWGSHFLTLSDLPNNSQICMFFREFAIHGYRCSADSIVTKFPFADGSRQLDLFSVGVSDGLTKLLIMFCVVCFLSELEVPLEDIPQEMREVLATFKLVRCTYTHFSNPGMHYLNSLSFLTRFNC
jgi:hypothetical protein